MEIEARGVEGEVVGVAIGGFEVTSGYELGRVPKTAPEIGDQRKLRPELCDLGHEDRVLVD